MIAIRNPRIGLAWTLIGLLGLGLLGCSQPPYTNIGNTEFKALMDQGVVVYDIRRPDEWRETGVVAGSERLTFVDASGRVQPEFLARFTAATDPGQPVILICRTGNRSRALARHLAEELGYTQVYNVRNGITDWIGEQHPVSRL